MDPCQRQCPTTSACPVMKGLFVSRAFQHSNIRWIPMCWTAALNVMPRRATSAFIFSKRPASNLNSRWILVRKKYCSRRIGTRQQGIQDSEIQHNKVQLCGLDSPLFLSFFSFFFFFLFSSRLVDPEALKPRKYSLVSKTSGDYFEEKYVY